MTLEETSSVKKKGKHLDITRLSLILQTVVYHNPIVYHSPAIMTGMATKCSQEGKRKN